MQAGVTCWQRRQISTATHTPVRQAEREMQHDRTVESACWAGMHSLEWTRQLALPGSKAPRQASGGLRNIHPNRWTLACLQGSHEQHAGPSARLQPTTSHESSTRELAQSSMLGYCMTSALLCLA